MTSNHLLLYRLAELMLQHEQHILPVDLLFDDEQIGDLVKSIQIDSPYQQLLLEGVLTESVLDEKLFVSFTVEGYFHFVLGEVIYKTISLKDDNYLMQLVLENKINGINEGVENCLITDTKNGHYFRLKNLIANGGKTIEVCIKPLSNYFINFPVTNNNTQGQANYEIDHVAKVMQELFSDTTDNEIDVLTKTIKHLENLQKHEICSLIYQKINEHIEPINIKRAIMYVKSIEYIDKELRLSKLVNLKPFQVDYESSSYGTFLCALAEQFKHVNDYDKAIENYEQSIRININLYGENHSSLATYYNNLGAIWGRKWNLDKAIEYHEKSLNISIKSHGEQHPSTGIDYINLGAKWIEKGDYDKALDYYEMALGILIKEIGNQHQHISYAYAGLGSVWQNKKEFKKAKEFWTKSHDIRLKVFGEMHSETAKSYQNLGSLWNALGMQNIALEHYEKALAIYNKLNLEHHDSFGHLYVLFGEIYIQKVDFAKAKATYAKAHQIFLNALGGNNPVTKSVAEVLALLNDL
jgi:tetratricopeptide (TPR) repeat protein